MALVDFDGDGRKGPGRRDQDRHLQRPLLVFRNQGKTGGTGALHVQAESTPISDAVTAAHVLDVDTATACRTSSSASRRPFIGATPVLAQHHRRLWDFALIATSTRPDRAR